MGFDSFRFRRYGVQTTIRFGLRQLSATNALPPDLLAGIAFAAGDTQISKDGGAFANTTNNPVAVGNGIYALTLVAAEMQAENITVTVKDVTVPAVCIGFEIEIEVFLEARRVLISNDQGDACTFEATGGNGDGLQLTGNGTGDGIESVGGATGAGGRFIGGATSGAGLNV